MKWERLSNSGSEKSHSRVRYPALFLSSHPGLILSCLESLEPSPMAASSSRSLLQSLKNIFKKPWEITGPCASPEYRDALPLATEYRLHCPATTAAKAIVPTSDPETVYDIKYFPRDGRHNRPPVKRTVLKKADVEQLMAEKTQFQFPPVYLTRKVEEDYNACGGGYQK
ncbi:Versican core protein [Rhynchospora pubera]|uniref:Versican core protein n=1 Tax=Rhynchospora pubera TaxID=906938 RepID=A0AAV8FQ37_9POAL|nr:Versican core protein [Rhynchospora pubera]